MDLALPRPVEAPAIPQGDGLGRAEKDASAIAPPKGELRPKVGEGSTATQQTPSDPGLASRSTSPWGGIIYVTKQTGESVMARFDRLALVDWLEGQIWLWEDSGELCREFAERVVDHIIGPSDIPKADGKGRRAVG